VVEDGVSGFLYPVGDIAGMADGCLALCRDEGLYADFSRQARDRVVEHFDSEKIIPLYEDLYQAVLGIE